ncbi:MAG: DNA repair protein RecN [Bdellovibrionaceae bacterium]|nr:DNA repair protein RecN [Pseudobdellovibrionaceae bacterium]
MLIELNVTNFAIIHHLRLEFGPGLNIISGETGAGKSVIVRALNLLMGAKSFSEDIRDNAEVATVEGYFDLKSRKDLVQRIISAGIDCSEKTLTVRRVISKDGKNRVYLNGHLSNLSDLKDIVSPLVDLAGRGAPLMEITGQHDNKNLMSPQFHLDIVDQFCDTLELRSQVDAMVTEKSRIKKRMQDILNSSKDRSQRIDFIRFQIDEIESLNLNSDSDKELEEKVRSLRARNANSEFINSMLEALSGSNDSISSIIDALLRKGTQLKYKDKIISESLSSLENVKVTINDIAYDLSRLTDESDMATQLDTLEERLSSLRKLEKKFGSSVQEILLAYDNMKKELLDLEQSDKLISLLQLETNAIDEKLKPVIHSLSDRRRKGTTKLKKAVNEELADLNMNGVIMSFAMETLPEPTVTGQDAIQLMIQNGAKSEPRPLHKTASGGELSRILLSLKIASGHIDVPRTYLFDEVDTGVSGPTAQKVGRKLKAIAQGQQVICITHLPQVASFADQHYFVAKSVKNGDVRMVAEQLENDKRVAEIARLISGEKITKTSLAHAEQLIESSLLGPA